MNKEKEYLIPVSKITANLLQEIANQNNISKTDVIDQLLFLYMTQKELNDHQGNIN